MTWEVPERDAFEFDGLITDAEFGYDDRFKVWGTDDLALILKIEMATSYGKPREEFFRMGAGWETDDGGKTVSHPTRTQFSKQSRVGGVIARLLELPGAMDELKDREPATSIDGWIGLNLHWKDEEYDTQDSDGKPAVRTHIMPVAFVADDEGAKPVGLAPKVQAALEKLALTVTNHEDFVAEAWKIDAVKNDKAVEQAVLDATRWTFAPV